MVGEPFNGYFEYREGIFSEHDIAGPVPWNAGSVYSAGMKTRSRLARDVQHEPRGDYSCRHASEVLLTRQKARCGKTVGFLGSIDSHHDW